MPRPGPPRKLVAVKLTEDFRDWIDNRAVAEGVVKPDGTAHRSRMMRRMLSYAALHMPKGWQPKG